MSDFPSGTVTRTALANAGDTGSIPGPGRFHMLRATKAWAPQLLEPVSSRAWEQQLMSPRAATAEVHVPRAHAAQEEKPPQWEAWARQQRTAPTHHNKRKPTHSNKDPAQLKIKK